MGYMLLAGGREAKWQTRARPTSRRLPATPACHACQPCLPAFCLAAWRNRLHRRASTGAVRASEMQARGAPAGGGGGGRGRLCCVPAFVPPQASAVLLPRGATRVWCDGPAPLETDLGSVSGKRWLAVFSLLDERDGRARGFHEKRGCLAPTSSIRDICSPQPWRCGTRRLLPSGEGGGGGDVCRWSVGGTHSGERESRPRR